MSNSITSTGGGRWQDAHTWDFALVPTATDDVLLNFSDQTRPNANCAVYVAGRGIEAVTNEVGGQISTLAGISLIDDATISDDAELSQE